MSVSIRTGAAFTLSGWAYYKSEYELTGYRRTDRDGLGVNHEDLTRDEFEAARVAAMRARRGQR